MALDRPTLRGLGEGWGAWLLLGWVAWTLPGTPWRAPEPGPFPWAMGLVWLGGLVLLLGLAFAVVAWVGPILVGVRFLAMAEALPSPLWAALLSAAWPVSWGPPGRLAWVLAFLLSGLPGELRWLAQALPSEFPLPAAYGRVYVGMVRRRALVHLLGPLLLARWPLWLMGTLALEYTLGVRGLGSDWAYRVLLRDRVGMALWLGALALVWSFGRLWKRPCA